MRSNEARTVITYSIESLKLGTIHPYRESRQPSAQKPKLEKAITQVHPDELDRMPIQEGPSAVL